MSKTTIENWTQSEEWKNVVKTLNLREETVSGVDEQGIVINFINKLLTTQKDELVKEIHEMLEAHAVEAVLTDFEKRFLTPIKLD